MIKIMDDINPKCYDCKSQMIEGILRRDNQDLKVWVCPSCGKYKPRGKFLNIIEQIF